MIPERAWLERWEDAAKIMAGASGVSLVGANGRIPAGVRGSNGLVPGTSGIVSDMIVRISIARLPGDQQGIPRVIGALPGA